MSRNACENRRNGNDFHSGHRKQNSSLSTCPLREEKSFSQRAFSIFTDSYTLRTRRLRFGYEQQFSRSSPGAYYRMVGKVMTMKVVFEKETYRLLGAQIIGYEGVDKRIDVLATAIYFYSLIIV